MCRNVSLFYAYVEKSLICKCSGNSLAFRGAPEYLLDTHFCGCCDGLQRMLSEWRQEGKRDCKNYAGHKSTQSR